MNLAERRIALEICPTSNLRTGALARQLGRPDMQTLEDHPLRRFFEHGVPVDFGSDDPAMFGTSLLGEYRLAAQTGDEFGGVAAARTDGVSSMRSWKRARKTNIIRRHESSRWVMLKSTVLDPQGKAIHHALASLGHQQVRDVRQGKFFVLDLKSASREQAKTEVEKIAREV